MRIGGYVPCSLGDFPGHIAAVIFTQGCNWRCPWCHNPALVYPKNFTAPLPEADILARLATRRGRLDGAVITGGEPTLHADLPDFIRRIRALGYRIKLDTNGSRPAVVRALLAARLIDYVAMDLKAPWPRYDEAAGVAVDIAALKETIALLRESGTPHQLRTTRWPSLTEADTPALAAIAQGSPHIWQTYRQP
ncbi:anaerobic ribonucleoside-triphosphate reductase activating protein [Termitidicoccus mucosus]|uniref:Anaerobic ribonucleoside-triphosphate reductase activating protein n=1 Tax=Termitidicoccus mucosus TaxID=1184151 RepID=A0A178IKB7_9BACT|nr:anaerobic ribonucleoside-triphosphate reductase activating protein [Opitutaceae bacterium TSB47]